MINRNYYSKGLRKKIQTILSVLFFMKSKHTALFHPLRNKNIRFFQNLKFAILDINILFIVNCSIPSVLGLWFYHNLIGYLPLLNGRFSFMKKIPRSVK